jgi:KaiC/GvpD/RAD55 family RecA-like ATPase
MRGPALPRLPIIEDLTKGPIPPGSNILVEFDGASPWYNASVTVAAGWLRTGGRVSYYCFAQPPDSIRDQLHRLGVDAAELEKNGSLEIWDWYTATLGLHSKETRATDSLKVADLSMHYRARMQAPISPDVLGIADDVSVLDRFNDEKNWVEYELARSIPAFKVRKTTTFRGILSDIKNTSVYKRLEGVHDGIIDFKLETVSTVTVTTVRIRMMRNVGFDSRWHPLRVSDDNFEVTLER